MTVWLLLVVVLLTPTALVLTGALRVRRHSRGHVVGCLAVRGRGVFFSRTPDGDWWKVRLRGRSCGLGGGWVTGGEDPPDIGVREPRPPSGPRPGTPVRLDLP
jgi:hypothetical protein